MGTDEQLPKHQATHWGLRAWWKFPNCLEPRGVLGYPCVFWGWGTCGQLGEKLSVLVSCQLTVVLLQLTFTE